MSPGGTNASFEFLPNILHESEIDRGGQHIIEVMLALWKDGFEDHQLF